MDYQALTKDKVDWIVPHLEEDAAVTVADARGSARNTQESRTEAVNTLLSIGSGSLVGARGIHQKREPKYYGTYDDDDEDL